MNEKVKKLQEWFNSLSEADQKAVIDFLYGDSVLVEGKYCGPNPRMVKTGGLHCGPVPKAPAVCPTCGKPW